MYFQKGAPHCTLKKRKFLLRISSANVTKPQIPADLVTFTEKILNGKLHFLRSANVRFAERLICVLSFHSRIRLWMFSQSSYFSWSMQVLGVKGSL